MMCNNGYLNYSHGTILQSFCSKLIADFNTNHDNNISQCLRWIDDEKRNLLKNQTDLWPVPVSEQTYYDYLVQIENLIKSNGIVGEFLELLKELQVKTRRKIHVLFLTQETFCWASLESVYWAAKNNEDFEVSLVYTPFYHANFVEQDDHYDKYYSMGVPVLRHYEYDLSKDSPDIAFMVKPYGNTPEQYQIKCLEKVISRIVYIPYGMEITVDLAKYGFQYYLHYKAWRHCAYGEIVKEYAKIYGYRGGKNVAVWGHPKADHYRNLDNNRNNIPEQWKRFINGRRVILWTPHHLIELEGTGTGTWLIWGKQILEIAFNNPDIAFIIRPHPLMEGALINSGAMSKSSFDRMLQRIKQSVNIIWDDSHSYHEAFDAADAIITDGTTFSIEFLYTKKPILLTPRNMKGFYLYERMLSSYYIGRTLQDIKNFIKMISEGEDPLKEKRIQLYKDTFYVPKNCSVGENIMLNIKNDLTQECVNIGSFLQSGEEKVLESNLNKSLSTTDKDYQFNEDIFPLFSVLIACYKNMDLLFEMLDTVFSQDYPKIQLIISDDGSEDFDVDKVQKYVDSHRRHNIVDVLVRKNEVNMKTVKHIYTALKHVTGEYVIITAADDRFVGTDVISQYVESFLNNPDAQWLVARCNVTTADYKRVIFVAPSNEDEICFQTSDALKIFSRWSRRGMAVPCCMAFKRTAFDLVGGIDLEYQLLEDQPLEFKLLRKGFVPIYLSCITANHSTGGVSNSNNRYSKEIAKLYFNDRFHLCEKEIEPYWNLMTPEDKKIYKTYKEEIINRRYFIFVEWPDTSIWQKIKLFIKKPKSFFWMLELWYVARVKHFERKKALIISQGFLLTSLFLLFFISFLQLDSISIILKIIAVLDFFLAIVLMVLAVVTYPLEKYFNYKSALRKKMVN